MERQCDETSSRDVFCTILQRPVASAVVIHRVSPVKERVRQSDFR